MAKKKKLIIILPTEKATALTVITYAKAVSKGMAAHTAIYPSPAPPLKTLDDAVKELEAADVPEGDRSPNTDLVLSAKKRVVIDILAPLSRYVLLIADGNRTNAALSGFQLSAEETVSRPPGEFRAVFVQPGPSDGTAIVRIEERAGCALFIVELKVEEKWVMIDAFNTLLLTVEGLPSGSSVLRIYGKKGVKKSPAVEIVVKAV